MIRAAGAVLASLLLAAVLAVVVAAPSDAAPITVRGPAAVSSYATASTTSVKLSVPSGTQSGDVLVALLGVGATSQPVITAPSGWTLAARTNQGTALAAAMYVHPFVVGETQYTWTTDRPVGGVASVVAYVGVDTASPIAAAAGRYTSGPTTSIRTPSVNTGVADSMLVAGFTGHRGTSGTTTWSTATGMTERVDARDPSGRRSVSLDDAPQAKAGGTGTFGATTSVSQDGGVGILLALRPAPASPTTTTAPTTTSTTAPTTTTTSTTTTSTTTTTRPPTSGGVPVIFDTDMFSDADDVGALATLFGLQLGGEARVVAIGVNTRTSRPKVARNSWRCAAAVAAFYNSSSVPIGTAMPNDGTDLNTVDFIGPCAKLAPSSTPTPVSAVTVFRRALAAEANGSVVMVEAGYQGNLAALLQSPGDSISPLNGRDLVAAKVKRLVAMGGGFPKDSGETNIAGDPAAAQYVSANWPTKIVWAGYEVGDEIHTGQTISTTHPTTSPVRVAYEAFVGPRNWIYSYDLVASYRGIRTDSSLAEVGPGTNVITSTGANSWSSGSGTQYYLTLQDGPALTSAIEGLITRLPGTTPPPPSGIGPTDTFDSNSLSSAWQVTTNGSTVAARNQRLEISHPAGSWTTGTLTSASTYDIRGRTTQVQVLRPANGGLGGTTFGETSVFLWIDSTHYVSFFWASGSLTARVRNGGTSETNITPTWPPYSATQMQWVRFRESGGTLYWEYAAGTTSPGPWTVLASASSPISLGAVKLRIVAGTNVAATDVAAFDNVATS